MIGVKVYLRLAIGAQMSSAERNKYKNKREQKQM